MSGKEKILNAIGLATARKLQETELAAVSLDEQLRQKEQAVVSLNEKFKTERADLAKQEFYRGYQAAQYSKDRHGWSIWKDSVLREQWAASPALRARAHNMLNDNPYARAMDFDRRYFIIGSGFDLQPLAKYPTGILDDFANNLIADKWKQFCRKQYFDVSRRFPAVMHDNLYTTALLETGLVIIRAFTKGKAIKDNPFGICFGIIEPEIIDHNKNERDTGRGTQIIAGFEIDEFRRYTGIWVNKQSPYDEMNSNSYSTQGRDFIPIDELIIAYDPLRFQDLYGLPLLAIALLTLKDVDIWEYLSLQNAKAGAGKGGYLVEKADGAFGTPPGAIDPTTGKPEVDEKGYKYMDIEGNTVEKLPRGLEFVGFDPKYPHEQHSPYLRSSGRKIFSGMGSDYAVVTGDREGESYSSFRGGEIKQDASAAYNQMLIIEMIKIPQYEMFIKYALRAGALAPLNMALYEKYLPCFFGAYRKPKADRLKEALADSLEEISGWVSKYTNQQKRSQNPDDILNDKIALLNMEQKKGMKFESTKPGDTTAAETANADNSTQNTNADAGAIPKKNLTAAPQLKEINELLNTMRSMYELLNKGEDNG